MTKPRIIQVPLPAGGALAVLLAWCAMTLPVPAVQVDTATVGSALVLSRSDTNPLIIDEVWVEFLSQELGFDDLFKPMGEDTFLLSLAASTPQVWILDDTPPAFDPVAELNDEQLLQVLALEPTTSAFWFEAGKRLYQQGNLKAGLEYVERAVQLDPDQDEYFDYYTGLLVLGKQYKRAVDLIRSSLVRNPYNILRRFNLACALAGLGARDASVEELLILHRMNWPNLFLYLGDKDLDPVRDHPAFIALENQLLEQTRRINPAAVLGAPGLRPSLQ